MADITRFVKQSFEDRVQSQLETSYSVHWQGTPFDTESKLEWIQPRDLGFTPERTNAGKRVEMWTMQIDCFCRVGEGGKSTNRVWEIADDVLDAFRNVTIDVLNWDESAPRSKVGELEFYLPDVTPVDAEGGLQRVSVTLSPIFNDL